MKYNDIISKVTNVRICKLQNMVFYAVFLNCHLHKIYVQYYVNQSVTYVIVYVIAMH